MNIQEHYNNELQDRIRGCLIGGAVGDALGYSVEFISYNQIIDKYGEKGITRYDLNSNGVAEISDDTQMTLYTANGILIDDIETAYKEWYNTQTNLYGTLANAKCWLSNMNEMYSRRAPGCTCLSALRDLVKGYTVQNNSKGCGGIMRVAPLGIYGAVQGIQFDKTAKMACEAARITHKHPLGYLPAGLLAATIQLILEEGNKISKEQYKHCINSALHAIITLCKLKGGYEKWQEADELMLNTNRAIDLAASNISDEEAIRLLGEGWTGEEAWYIAIFCTLRHFDNLEAAIISAVNHSGDSDSTGTICGNIIGAIHGYNAIPIYYKQNLELHDVILNMADILSGNKVTKCQSN